MDEWDSSTYRGSERGHICNCIGCCRKCGTCRTAPWHTPAYCELVQRQTRERVDLVAQKGTASR